jgi:hypothetical protein
MSATTVAIRRVGVGDSPISAAVDASFRHRARRGRGEHPARRTPRSRLVRDRTSDR